MIGALRKPQFKIDAEPYGIIVVPVCSKACWDNINYALLAKTPSAVTEAWIMLDTGLPESAPISIKISVMEKYIKAVEKYCEIFKDIFEAPSKPDFESEEVPIRLPVATYKEHTIHEYSGLSFDQISELDILDFRMLFADAVKIRILRRADGKGREYLNECYDYMHQISDIFD